MGEGGCFHRSWGQEAGRFRSGEPMATVAMGLSQIRRRPWCGASHLRPRHRAPQRCPDARARGLACLPRALKKARPGLRAGAADLQSCQLGRSWAWARLGKKLGAPFQGDVSGNAQAWEEEPASPERRACWQRRRPGAGLAEASEHGDLGAEGPWAPEGRACWEKAGEGGGDHGCARRGLQMVPEQLWARKTVR